MKMARVQSAGSVSARWRARLSWVASIAAAAGLGYALSATPAQASPLGNPLDSLPTSIMWDDVIPVQAGVGLATGGWGDGQSSKWFYTSGNSVIEMDGWNTSAVHVYNPGFANISGMTKGRTNPFCLSSGTAYIETDASFQQQGIQGLLDISSDTSGIANGMRPNYFPFYSSHVLASDGVRGIHLDGHTTGLSTGAFKDVFVNAFKDDTYDWDMLQIGGNQFLNLNADGIPIGGTKIVNMNASNIVGFAYWGGDDPGMAAITPQGIFRYQPFEHAQHLIPEPGTLLLLASGGLLALGAGRWGRKGNLHVPSGYNNKA